ncbi:NADPH:quinone oxidoreductase family protein [Streptomyces sp. GbtcB7]|uniref:NADPH:quinone oxidoreductase family protein n=1 Tax=Streptomyces sp. GbtcB7 TaxID=2824752 RepID=UPI0020C65DB2|nr:NADPH:quinone oxidoreductase family protein [Streptomyces sp. GbtcB7]
MKALVVSELIGPKGMDLVEVPEPTGGGRVLIDVHAAGVCYPDLLMTYGRYQLRPKPPFTPGAELAGVVASAPDGSGFHRGQKVVAVRMEGGCFAERVAIEPAMVAPLPGDLDFAEGAALVVNHYTVLFALRNRIRLEAGQTLLVLGAAGGIGSAAVQVGKALGARVIAVARRTGTADFLRGLGADEVVALADGWAARVRELTGGAGVDAVVDPVGGTAFDNAVRILAPGGNLLVLGFAGGDIPRVKVNRLVLRNVSVVGVAWGEHMQRLPGALGEASAVIAGLVESGAVRPLVAARYPLSEGRRALLDLEEGKIVGKAVLEVG